MWLTHLNHFCWRNIHRWKHKWTIMWWALERCICRLLPVRNPLEKSGTCPKWSCEGHITVLCDNISTFVEWTDLFPNYTLYCAMVRWQNLEPCDSLWLQISCLVPLYCMLHWVFFMKNTSTCLSKLTLVAFSF